MSVGPVCPGRRPAWEEQEARVCWRRWPRPLKAASPGRPRPVPAAALAAGAGGFVMEGLGRGGRGGGVSQIFCTTEHVLHRKVWFESVGCFFLKLTSLGVCALGHYLFALRCTRRPPPAVLLWRGLLRLAGCMAQAPVYVWPQGGPSQGHDKGRSRSCLCVSSSVSSSGLCPDGISCHEVPPSTPASMGRAQL